MEIALARRARLELEYRGKNLDLHTTQVTYVDNAEGKLDSLEVRLEDREGLWRDENFPAKSDHLHARIFCYDWFTPGQKLYLDCGSFEIDAISVDGPPDTVTISAFAAKASQNGRTERKVQKWEPAVLSAIAGEIAKRAGLTLYWMGNDHEWKRREQREEGDLNFLNRLCKATGNFLKVVDDKAYIYSDEMIDAFPVVAQLIVGSTWIKTYHFRTQLHDVYQAAKVDFWEFWERKWYSSNQKSKNTPPTKEVIKLRQRAESIEDAERIAKSGITVKNRAEIISKFTLVGDPALRATTRVGVDGFGVFDGTYFVQQATHVLDSQQGYTTALKLLKR